MYTRCWESERDGRRIKTHYTKCNFWQHNPFHCSVRYLGENRWLRMRIHLQKWPISGTQADGHKGILLGFSIYVTSQKNNGRSIILAILASREHTSNYFTHCPVLPQHSGYWADSLGLIYEMNVRQRIGRTVVSARNLEFINMDLSSSYAQISCLVSARVCKFF